MNNKIKTVWFFFLVIILFIIIFETLVRSIIFLNSNLNIFKYGFNKSVSFSILDLSDLNFLVSDEKNIFKNKKIKNNKNKIWIFGGSTTRGFNCLKNSSSWPIELQKINQKFNFINFAKNGNSSDDQLLIFEKELLNETPHYIFWAPKFNEINVVYKRNYRNKKILNYDFSLSGSYEIIFLKRIDATLRNYLVFYLILDRVINKTLEYLDHEFGINKKQIDILPNKNDEFYAIKNFEINTLRAIEMAQKSNVKYFFIISLFNLKDLSKIKQDRVLKFYDLSIQKISNKFPNFVKVIETKTEIKDINTRNLLCDDVHQTLNGNTLQANIINKKIEID